MRLYFALFVPVIISPLFALSRAQQNDPNLRSINDIDAAKLKIAQLETVLEETIRNVDSKTLYLKEREEVIQDSEFQIRDLQSALYGVKNDLPEVRKRISELEEEVKLLWAALRKSNFDLHVLKDKAREADDKVEVAASEVEKIFKIRVSVRFRASATPPIGFNVGRSHQKTQSLHLRLAATPTVRPYIMSDFVTDQWIQIQHLEQMREFNARRHGRTNRCTFLKFMNDLREKQLPKVRQMIDIRSKEQKLSIESYLSQIMLQLKGFWAAVTKYHHQFQGFIKNEMEKNEIMAAFANREVVFFVASALITFPVLGAWLLLSSYELRRHNSRDT